MVSLREVSIRLPHGSFFPSEPGSIFAFNSPILVSMFNPDAHLPRPNRSLVYLGACIIAGMRLARERQVNVRVIPTSNAIEESVDLAHEIFNRVFRKVPGQMLE